MVGNDLFIGLIIEICSGYPRVRRVLFALAALAFVVFAGPWSMTMWLGLAFVGILAGVCEVVAPRD